MLLQRNVRQACNHAVHLAIHNAIGVARENFTSTIGTQREPVGDLHGDGDEQRDRDAETDGDAERDLNDDADRESTHA